MVRILRAPFPVLSRTKLCQFFIPQVVLFPGRDGTEMEDAIAVLEIALHDAEELSYIEPATLAALLRLQGIYYRESLFRQGRKIMPRRAHGVSSKLYNTNLQIL